MFDDIKHWRTVRVKILDLQLLACNLCVFPSFGVRLTLFSRRTMPMQL